MEERKKKRKIERKKERKKDERKKERKCRVTRFGVMKTDTIPTGWTNQDAPRGRPGL